MPCYLYLALGGENKISIFDLERESGRLQWKEDVPLSGSPGPLATDPECRFLYAGVRSTCQIASFRIEPRTGRLSPIGIISLETDPCYLRTDRRGRFLLSAYYRGGRVAVHPIDEKGAVLAPPVEWRATAPGAHSIQTDPTNRFAFVPHVAESNAIFQFEFDEQTGRLTPNPLAPRLVPPVRVGPRHFTFHPTLNILYCDEEQGSSVTAYHLDPQTGTLAAFQTLSTLPEGYTGENTCAQIHLAPPGRFLYVSNRGHDSIAGFAVEDGTGQLTPIGHQPTEQTPRAFNVDPHGRFLYVGGLGTGRLAAHRLDPQTGALAPLAIYEVGKGPMWVLPLCLED